MSGGDGQAGRRRWLETGPRAITRRPRVVAATEEENYACGLIDWILSEIFPPVSKSGRDKFKDGDIGLD